VSFLKLILSYLRPLIAWSITLIIVLVPSALVFGQSLDWVKSSLPLMAMASMIISLTIWVKMEAEVRVTIYGLAAFFVIAFILDLNPFITAFLCGVVFPIIVSVKVMADENESTSTLKDSDFRDIFAIFSLAYLVSYIYLVLGHIVIGSKVSMFTHQPDWFVSFIRSLIILGIVNIFMFIITSNLEVPIWMTRWFAVDRRKIK
jgi:hypothetical protein